MLARRIAAAIALGSTLLCAEDFSLTQNGIGPITVHTTLTFEGQGERLLAVAVNDSGQLISHVRFCVVAGLEACLFGLEVAEPWQPGKTVRWNQTAVQHIPDLSHYVRIVALTLATPKQEMAIPEADPTNEVRAAQVASPQPAAEILTNEAILRLVKAGLGDEVILGMVSSQQGKYSVDTDSVIALKQAGVSDRVIASMMTKASNTTSAKIVETRIASSEPLFLHDGTPVRMRLSRNLSSADAKTGDTIDFEVLDDVPAGDFLVIKRGAVAIGSVTDAEKKRRMARGGKLDVAIDYVRAVTDDKIALRGVKETSGGGHTGAMTAGIVATALIVWPAAPFFLFMHGKDVVIPKGTEITAYVNGDVKLDKLKLTAK
jgi:hypothetical protein